MKLEKREITLNEADSLRDLLYFEKGLHHEYVKGAQSANRKETEREFLRLQNEVQEEIGLLDALLNTSLHSVGIAAKKSSKQKE